LVTISWMLIFFHLQIIFHDIYNLSHHIFIVQKYDGWTKTVEFENKGPILQNGENRGTKTTIKSKNNYGLVENACDSWA